MFLAGTNPVVLQAVSSMDRLESLLGDSCIKDVPRMEGERARALRGAWVLV